MSWLKNAKVEGPTEVEHLPVVYSTIYEYDLARLKRGDSASWVMEITVEQGGATVRHEFRLVMEVK